VRSEERRKRTEANEAWVTQHPVAAWILFAFVFSLVSLALQLSKDGVQWVRVATIGPAVALGLVIGIVIRDRLRRRARDRR